MKLISMTDFVLEQCYPDVSPGLFYFLCSNYAFFLKQRLTLGMFVPCDEDGNVLEEPNNYELWTKRALNTPYDLDLSKYEKYQQAQERVLFDGFEIIHQDNVRLTIYSGFSQLDYNINKGEFENYNTIEDLVHLDLILTSEALKQIGL